MCFVEKKMCEVLNFVLEAVVHIGLVIVLMCSSRN